MRDDRLPKALKAWSPCFGEELTPQGRLFLFCFSSTFLFVYCKIHLKVVLKSGPPSQACQQKPFTKRNVVGGALREIFVFDSPTVECILWIGKASGCKPCFFSLNWFPTSITANNDYPKRHVRIQFKLSVVHVRHHRCTENNKLKTWQTVASISPTLVTKVAC